MQTSCFGKSNNAQHFLKQDFEAITNRKFYVVGFKSSIPHYLQC